LTNFALDAERSEGCRRRAAIHRLPDALPAHHDDHIAAILGSLPLALGLGSGFSQSQLGSFHVAD